MHCTGGTPPCAPQAVMPTRLPSRVQRSGVLIDSLHLGHGHSSHLQQAAYLTGGTYLKPARPAALVQYLNVRRGGLCGACVAGAPADAWRCNEPGRRATVPPVCTHGPAPHALAWVQPSRRNGAVTPPPPRRPRSRCLRLTPAPASFSACPAPHASTSAPPASATSVRSTWGERGVWHGRLAGRRHGWQSRGGGPAGLPVPELSCLGPSHCGPLPGPCRSYVCSACLSIFCQQLPACTTCGTEFGAGQKK